MTATVSEASHAPVDATNAPRASVARPALLAVVGLVLGLSPFAHGAYSPGVWAPAGIAIAALLVGLLVMGARRPTPAALVALLGLTGLGLFTLISGSWSPTPALASEHGQRLLVLAGLLALLVTLIQDRRDAAAALGGAVGGIGAIALWTLTQLLGSSGDELFLGGRLHEPLEYINGQGSIYVLAFGACLAATGARSPLAAGGAAALAALFADLALLSQSRGVLITLVLATLTVVACVGGRQRRAVGALVVAAAVATAAPTLLDLLGQYTWRGLPEGSTQPVGRAIVVSMVVAGTVWGGLVTVERGVTEGSREVLRRAAAVALAAIAAVALVGAAANGGRIADRVSTQVDAFTKVEIPTGAVNARLLSGSGTRYDYWRIAASTFADHPLAGAGGGGFKVSYYRERQTPENILQAHSVTFQTLADLGLLGLAALVVFYGALVRGLVATARRAGEATVDRVLAAAACGMAVAWVAHSNIDWILLLPGVTGVAFVGLAVGLRAPRGVPAPTPLPRLVAAGAGALAAVLIALTTLGLVERLQVRHDLHLAREVQRAEPERAIRIADRAISRDGDALEAYYVKAAAQARLGRKSATLATLRAAARQEPTEFVTWGLLGDVLARVGDDAAAREAYGRALRLNPREDGLKDALQAVGGTAGPT